MMRKLLAALVSTLPLFTLAAATPATQRVHDAATTAAYMPSFKLADAPPAVVAWRAPGLEPVDLVSMPAVTQLKSSAAIAIEVGAPLQVGTDQPLEKAASIVKWSAVPGGFVAKIRASSEGAVGLRVRLDLGTVPGGFSLVAQGSGSTRLEAMPIDPTLGNSHWTPWTEGSSQVIELFSPVLPSPGAVSVAVVANFMDSPIQPKAGSASCTIPASCTTGDPVLDGAIADRVKSNVKILFSNGSGQFVCTATLINSPLAPAPFLLTANHCINTVAEASTIATFFFYETQSCTELGTAPGLTQVAGATTLVFTNFAVDSSLVRMNQAAPAGAVFSSWNAARIANGSSIVSVSHPAGDSSRIALGTVAQEFRVGDWPYDMYGITFTKGIIEGGSSGSGLYTLNNGALDLRGILYGTTTDNSDDGLSCTDTNEFGLYSRFEVFEPEIDQYISGNIRTDDAPNRVQDFTGVPVTDPPIDQTPKVYSNMQINYPGDVDVYRFTLISPVSNVHIYATGGLDTVGVLMDSNGTEMDANDDESSASTDFGITHSLPAGVYYVGVGHWDPAGTGTYTLHITTQTSTPVVNYTDLWWNSPANSESGWGLNLNHQGDIIFATLFTYDASGNPLWLVMSNGAKQTDGSFKGDLFTTTGDAFNASPWKATDTAATNVGSMTLAFSDASTGTLTYTYNGTTVTKHIIREVFATPVTCTTTTGDRSTATNYQDLWWNPNESGWGMNITQQGTTAFATLFDYDANGKPLWFVMSNGPQTTPGNFSGDLYTVKGPAFNSSPWDATKVAATKVGTMSFHFTSGSTGTLTYTVNSTTVTKSIQRQTFSSPLPQCQ